MAVTTTPSTPQDFPAAVLYLDDLNEIIDVMVRAVGGRTDDNETDLGIIVSDQNKLADTTDDLRSLPKPYSNDISILVQREGQQIDLIIAKNYVGLVFTKVPEPIKLMVADRLRQIFASRKLVWRNFVRDVLYAMSNPIGAAVSLLLMLFLAANVVTDTGHRPIGWHGWVIMAVLATVGTLPVLTVLWHSKVVFLSNAEQVRLKRERSTAAWTFIASHLATFALGLLTAWIVGRYLKR